MNDTLYYIDHHAREVIRQVMLRLYSEKRMSGDDMRNAAQQLQAALDSTMRVP
jgi:hypothetical protein